MPTPDAIATRENQAVFLVALLNQLQSDTIEVSDTEEMLGDRLRTLARDSERVAKLVRAAHPGLLD